MKWTTMARAFHFYSPDGTKRVWSCASVRAGSWLIEPKSKRARPNGTTRVTPASCRQRLGKRRGRQTTKFRFEQGIMTSSVVVWDIETVPDLKGFTSANNFGDKSDDEVRAELG